MDNSKRTKITAAAACVGLLLMIAVASIVLQPPVPLTATERRLLGDWKHIGLPGKEKLTGMSFAADRRFYSHNGEFVGQWSISGGQLHVKYWSVDWCDDWSIWRLTRVREALHVSREDWNIIFDKKGDRVELAQPGQPPECALIRILDR
ncbi:MAG TPA: hypothetical protein VFI31_23545 [Pirellulales bacterium]|nr:hypothetical protein [Pirellulales bacterium]